MGPEELRPRRSTLGCGLDPMVFEHALDRVVGEDLAQVREGALDAAVSQVGLSRAMRTIRSSVSFDRGGRPVFAEA